MISHWARRWIGTAWQPLVRLCLRLHITPNLLTLSGVAFAVLAGASMALGNLTAGAGLYLLANIFDSLDGELARTGHQETRLGPFLDSICDHLGDFAIYLGLLGFYLGKGERLPVILLFFTLFGSVFGSHVRSRGGMFGVDTKKIGVFTRLERTVLIVAGIGIRQVPLALGLLAFFTNFSAIQRVVYVSRRLKADESFPEKPAEGNMSARSDKRR